MRRERRKERNKSKSGLWMTAFVTFVMTYGTRKINKRFIILRRTDLLCPFH